METDNQADVPVQLKPFLREGVEMDLEGERVAQLTTHFVRYPFDEENGILLGRILPHLDGRNDLEQVSRLSGLDVEQVQQVVTSVYALGLVGDLTDVRVDPLLFLKHVWGTERIWPYSAPAVEALLYSNPLPQLAVGMLVEEWHFIRVNPSHIGAAVVNACNERAEQIWSKFLSEEYNHAQWLEESLLQVITQEEMQQAHPLCGTQAVNNALRMAARSDELSYAGCLSLAESGPGDNGSAAHFMGTYQTMLDKGLVPKAALEGFIRHINQDLDVEHLSLCREIYQMYGPLTLEQRQRILRHVWDYSHATYYQQREIVEFYGRPDAPRVFSLPHNRPSASLKSVVAKPDVWKTVTAK